MESPDQSIYEAIRAMDRADDPAVLEAIRLELEERAASLRDPGEPVGSAPVCEIFNAGTRAEISSVMAASIELEGLIATCRMARLALSELCERIGKVV